MLSQKKTKKKKKTVTYPSYSETLMGSDHWEEEDRPGEFPDRELCSQAAQERHKASVAVVWCRQTAELVCHITLSGGAAIVSFPPQSDPTVSALAVLFPRPPSSRLSLFPSLKHPRPLYAWYHHASLKKSPFCIKKQPWREFNCRKPVIAVYLKKEKISISLLQWKR